MKLKKFTYTGAIVNRHELMFLCILSIIDELVCLCSCGVYYTTLEPDYMSLKGWDS
jgi:hypothetical protein